jgi:N-acetylneuraminate synthase
MTDLNQRPSTPGAPRVKVIAEAGVNHNGERDKAFALIEVAADAGADFVKFQTFKADKIATPAVGKAAYQTRTTDAAESQLAMLKALELPYEWHPELQAHAASRGIEFISTAFDLESLALLAELGIPLVKVPSGELTNAPLLWRFARLRLPLVLSTGMATLSDVEQALAIVAHALRTDAEPMSLEDVWRSWSDPAARAALEGMVTLLHCTSQYPTPLEEVNLSAMDTLRAFGLPVGYSDHSQGLLIPLAAVARGACLVEKHFTLDRSLPGPDHAASLEPDELGELVHQVRAIETALGDGRKLPQPSEWDTRKAARQTIVAANDIAAGEIFTRENLTTARAGGGMEPALLWGLVGQTATRAYRGREPIGQ